MRSLHENVYLQRHPLSMAGCQLGRTVTLIRLSGGELVIHSTAKFSPQDIEEIAGLGEPAWMIEASNFHDTQARAGRAAFPDVRYLVPSGFAHADKLRAETLDRQLPAELEVIEIGGAPELGEHAVFHRDSKTLILADLLFNLPPTSVSAWTRLVLRLGTGIKRFPGNCLLFRHYIKDRLAAERSMRQLADLDFDKVVVGHGEPLLVNAKDEFVAALRRAGFSL